MDPKSQKLLDRPTAPLDSHDRLSADRTSAKSSDRIPNQVTETQT